MRTEPEHRSDIQYDTPVKFLQYPSQDDKNSARTASSIALGIVSRQKRIEQQDKRIEELGIDSLTGLFSRKLMDEDLPRLLERANKGGSRLALAFIDIDKFSRFNNEHGHKVGDAVLRAVGGGVRSATRLGDRAYRFGGDEIVVVFGVDPNVETADEQLAAGIGERLRVGINESVHTTGMEVGVSIGVAFSNPSDDVLSLVERADESMYSEKTQK